MRQRKRIINAVLGGGGIKGIAYAGVLSAAEKKHFIFGNMAGVSSGALAGSYIAAGYSAQELRQILENFDFAKIKIDEIRKKVPAVQRFIEYRAGVRGNSFDALSSFIKTDWSNGKPRVSANVEQTLHNDEQTLQEQSRNVIKNIITFSKEGALMDGDYLEEWVYITLNKKGIKTFGDIESGIPDRVNPKGRRIRMTAVDANRGKVVVLPDDMTYYGIDPDKFEVAKAVRMSTCVPFAFKPVQISFEKDGEKKTHLFVDGGVLDGFPGWLVSSSVRIPAAGFILDSGKKKLFSLDTPINILKGLYIATHDIGVPKNYVKPPFIANIDTDKISFLDFGIDEKDKKYLYDSGFKSGCKLFDMIANNPLYSFVSRFFG